MRSARLPALACFMTTLGAFCTAHGADLNANVRIVRSPVTKHATFFTMRDGSPIPVAPRIAAAVATPLGFFAQYGPLFGIDNARTQLRADQPQRDIEGFTHTTMRQVHRGVPVFGGVVKTHQDGDGAFVAANGHVFPVSPKLDSQPTIDRASAERLAIVEVGAGGGLATHAELVVVDPGWYGNRPTGAHLAYFIRVVDDTVGVAEALFINAHTGAVLDRWNVMETLKDRVIHNPAGGFAFPGPIARTEGQPPSADDEVNRAYDYAGDVYDYFFRAFGRDSFDDAGGTMRAIVNTGVLSCPNAAWTGNQAVFCTGQTLDDIVAHEFTHAVVQHSASLLFLNQPGQLNESFADVFGELIDLFNGDAAFPDVATGPPWPMSLSGPGLDAPNFLRGDVCVGGVSLRIDLPVDIAGSYVAGGASFGPALDEQGITSRLVLADPPLACPGGVNLVNAEAVAGNIAVIDLGSCTFVEKVLNAQSAGAVGVVIVNNTAGAPPGIGGSGLTVAIPTISIAQSDGALIKTSLSSGLPVRGTIHANGFGAGVRWLVGESVGDPGIRDMWSPTCMGNPDRANHPFQTCATNDNGGVHSGSGVPNHAFALVTDGGAFNGFTVDAIGPIKSGAVWYRALTTYLTVTSDFEDAFAGLTNSARDLVGTFPRDPRTGLPSSDRFTAHDADQVTAALRAVEMDTPGLCGAGQFVLDPRPPTICRARRIIYDDDFESGVNGWTVSHTTLLTPYDWVQTDRTPLGAPGTAWFAADRNIGDCEGFDESGVHFLTSPSITIPPDIARPVAAFTHFMAAEDTFDGGNLKISVNGGDFVLVNPATFSYNAYNSTLQVFSGNPLRGEAAFTGIGSKWGTSLVELLNYAVPGDRVRLRFDFGKDGCTGILGWYLADFAVVDCLEAGDGDFDDSGRVDLRDHAALQRCMGLPISGNLECQAVNLDNDETVGLADHALLIEKLQGP